MERGRSILPRAREEKRTWLTDGCGHFYDARSVAGDPVARRRRGGDGGGLGFISSVPAGWTSFLFRFWLGSRHLAAGQTKPPADLAMLGKNKNTESPPQRHRGRVG